MTSFADLKHQMDLLNGYVEGGGSDGHSGNITKIWAELQPSLQGQPWCAAADCYLWKHAGHPYPAIDHAWGFSYCPDAVIWAKKNGLWSASGHYEPGDTIFFDWTGGSVAEHTGTVVEERGSNGILTFEGNTQVGAQGNQSNGGGAYFKIRPHGNQVMGVLKSSRWLANHPNPAPKPTHVITPAKRKTNPFHLDPHSLPLHVGSRGTSVKFAQWALSVPVDGTFGPQTRQATVVFQRSKGLRVDGIIGPQTASALAHILH